MKMKYLLGWCLLAIISLPSLAAAHPGDDKKFSIRPQFEGYSDGFVLMVNVVGFAVVSISLIGLIGYLWRRKSKRDPVVIIRQSRRSILFIAAMIYLSSLGIVWDVWWHYVVGRDSFWIAPHMVSYAPLVVVGFYVFWLWWQSRAVVWEKLLVPLIAMPIAVGLDDRIWHQLFGSERVNEIWIAWSPAHILIEAILIAIIVMVLSMVVYDEKSEDRWWLGPLLAGTTLPALFFLTSPFHPVSQWPLPWAVLGFWGAAFTPLPVVMVLVGAQRWLGGKATALLTMSFFLVNNAMMLGGEVADTIVDIPHQLPPINISIMAFLAGAVILDLLRQAPAWLAGAVSGFFYTTILYWGASYFLTEPFLYSFEEAMVAIGSGTVGGLIGGLLVKWLVVIELPKRLVGVRL